MQSSDKSSSNYSSAGYSSHKDPRLAKQMLSCPPDLSAGMRCEPLAFDVEALFYPRLRALFSSDQAGNPIVCAGKTDNRSFERNYLLLPSGKVEPEDEETEKMRARNKKRDDVVFSEEMSEEERKDKRAKLDRLDAQAMARDVFRRTKWSYGKEERTEKNNIKDNSTLPSVISDLAVYCRGRFKIRGDSPCRITVGLYMRQAGTSIEAPPKEVLNRILFSFNEAERYTLSPYILKKATNSSSDRVSSGLPEQTIRVVREEESKSSGDTKNHASTLPRSGYGALYNMGPASLARYRILVPKNPVQTKTSRMPTGPGIKGGKSKSTVRRGAYERITAVVDFYASESIVQEADFAKGLTDPNLINNIMSRFSQISGIELPGFNANDEESDIDGDGDDGDGDGNERGKRELKLNTSGVARPSKSKRRRRKKKTPIPQSNNPKQIKKTLDSLNQIKDQLEEMIPKELMDPLTEMFGSLMDPSNPEQLDLSKIEELIGTLGGTEEKEEENKDGLEKAAKKEERERNETLSKLRRVRQLELMRRRRRAERK